jgi:hypothetical protein
MQSKESATASGFSEIEALLCFTLLCSALLYKPAASGPLPYYPLSHGSRLLLLLLFKGFGDVYLQPQIHNDLQCSWSFLICLN